MSACQTSKKRSHKEVFQAIYKEIYFFELKPKIDFSVKRLLMFAENFKAL